MAYLLYVFTKVSHAKFIRAQLFIGWKVGFSARQFGQKMRTIVRENKVGFG